jgi:hypothetical protein
MYYFKKESLVYNSYPVKMYYFKKESLVYNSYPVTIVLGVSSPPTSSRNYLVSTISSFSQPGFLLPCTCTEVDLLISFALCQSNCTWNFKCFVSEVSLPSEHHDGGVIVIIWLEQKVNREQDELKG